MTATREGRNGQSMSREPWTSVAAAADRADPVNRTEPSGAGSSGPPASGIAMVKRQAEGDDKTLKAALQSRTEPTR
jgi:hypothetical protein